MAGRNFRNPSADRARLLVVGALAAMLLAAARSAGAKSFTTLYAFGGADGYGPRAGLLADRNGNLYGTTQDGGDLSICHQQGCGTVFKLSADGSETLLHAFEGPKAADGRNPVSALIMDKEGNLYGTTVAGGGYFKGCSGDCGTVFKIAPDGTETILHAFTGGTSDGSGPAAGLLRDKAGNLYGTTQAGGGTGCSSYGCGVVFKLAPDGSYALLYVFTGAVDGGTPGYGSLIQDDSGDLYGTAVRGGDLSCGNGGCGVVYKLTRHGRETVLHSFVGSDGAGPTGLDIDAAGNLYGTAQSGGTACTGAGCGTVFKLAPDGTYTLLHTFAGGSDGSFPNAGPVLGLSGNLYGTTAGGGGDCNCGVVFRIAPDGTEKILHAFAGGDDGYIPVAPLTLGRHGVLYGNTLGGGGSHNCNLGCGTIFRLQ